MSKDDRKVDKDHCYYHWYHHPSCIVYYSCWSYVCCKYVLNQTNWEENKLVERAKIVN